jgi:acetone carboxylase gamma subunit
MFLRVTNIRCHFKNPQDLMGDVCPSSHILLQVASARLVSEGGHIRLCTCKCEHLHTHTHLNPTVHAHVYSTENESMGDELWREKYHSILHITVGKPMSCGHGLVGFILVHYPTYSQYSVVHCFCATDTDASLF